MANYDFNQNKACEYFPCHKTDKPEEFSCLFCYCPLYALGHQLPDSPPPGKFPAHFKQNGAYSGDGQEEGLIRPLQAAVNPPK